jgi:hypothetical protein
MLPDDLLDAALADAIALGQHPLGRSGNESCNQTSLVGFRELVINRR